MGEIDQLAKDLGLETETVEIPDFEKLEKAEMYDNIKKIADALENNQNILLELLKNILKTQEQISRAINQLLIIGVPASTKKKKQPWVPSPIPPPAQTPIDWVDSPYCKTTAGPQTAVVSWKALAWQKKPWMHQK